MAKNTSVLLGDYFDTFIQEKVASGRYKSASEVVRSALRLLEKEEEKLEILRAEIQKGIDSPKIYDYDPQKHLEEIHEKYESLHNK